ncbi:cytochrome ubiquinol oxidase subunit I, partial [uncultured Georgenia sp.]|uniref:cytochrome ubiquinol oxidase subunit I n=1 Tax=uncultured Georgenia sp. TaxID=378209 RepID=UPI002633F848
IFTEMGRQPWVVHPNPANPVDQVMLLTVDGVSTVVEPGTVLLSLVVFTLLYLALGIVWYRLIRRYVREGVEPIERPEAKDVEPEPEPTLSFAY